jgi:hypothetical protein
LRNRNCANTMPGKKRAFRYELKSHASRRVAF